MSSPSQEARVTRCRRGAFGSGGVGHSVVGIGVVARGVALVWFAAAALAGSASTAHAGDSASEPDAGGAQASYAIEIRNFAFTPKELLVPAGARVVWTNRDEEPHLVVSVSGAFKPSPALDTDDSFSAVLAKPGTYEYYCGIHPQMVGRIVVR